MKNQTAEIKAQPLHSGKRRIPVMACLLLGTFVLSCTCGSVRLSFTQLIDGVLWQDGAENASVIFYYLRLPRAVAAVLAGIGLSVSGVLLQSVTGNALASPNIIGVNSGAGFCCILLLSFFPAAAAALPLAAFAGAFGTTLLIVAIAQRISASKGTVILAGIACTSVLNAGISFLSLLDTDVLASYNAFSVGGLSGVKMEQLLLPAILIAVCLTVSLVLARRIHLLCLGDALAQALGVRIRALRLVCLICASACAAAVVSFAGLLGFVGLVVPHIARRLAGPATGPLLVTSVFVGPTLVLLADLLGRVLLAPTEIPVGVVMALVGAPFFFFLLLKRREADAEM